MQALTDAKSYTDAQIKAIPTPDVSGQISAHNKDTAAHQDIRTALGKKENAGAAASVQTNLNTHTGNANIHVTADDKAKWNGAATKPKACLVTLKASGWDATAKTQVATVASVVADEAAQMIHPMPKIGQITDYNDAGIQLIGQGEGKVTFMCDTIPEKNIEVWVVTEDVEDVTPSANIYGVQWDGTATTLWSRTDDAAGLHEPLPAVNNGTGSSPFDGKMPWAGIVKETDATAGVLVKIPKFWYKWTRSGKSMKLQIADAAVDGFHTSPAHADRGDGKGERDYVYVGRYHCASGYKSQTGSQPQASITRSQARTNIHNLGAAYWQYDFAMYWTIMMLYLVEYADWNSQKTIGYGCSPGGRPFNMGLTDAMQYHTGTNAASRTSWGCTQYRYIEGLWDNVADWADGIYFAGANVYCIKNPAQFSDTGNGTLVGTRAASGGYISEWTNPTVSGFEYALYPNAVNGSEDTYVCDDCGWGGGVLFVGSYDIQSQEQGAFFLNGNFIGSDSSSIIGCRLQKLP